MLATEATPTKLNVLTVEKFVAPDIKSPETELLYISINSNARIATKSFQPNLESGWFYYISTRAKISQSLHFATIDSNPDPTYNGNKKTELAPLYIVKH